MKAVSKSLLNLYMPIIIISILLGGLFLKNDAFTSVKNIFRPIFVAFSIAYILDSIANAFNKKLKLNRKLSILLTYVLFIGLIVIAVSFMFPIIKDNFNSLVSFFVSGNIDINAFIRDLKENTDNQFIIWGLERLTDSTGDISQQVIEYVNKSLLYISNASVNFVTNAGFGMLSVFSSFVISIYMLLEKDELLKKARDFNYAYLNQASADKSVYIVKKANMIFKRYFSGKILDSSIVGFTYIIAFYIFKVPYAPLMGTIVGAANMVPYFGTSIGSIPVIIVSLFINPPKALVAIIIIVIVAQIDGNIIDPKITGRAVGVSPFWIISAVTIGAIAAGPLGMILGVPFVVLVKTLIEEDVERKLQLKVESNSPKDKPL